jgi:pilus assembly protein CpaB
MKRNIVPLLGIAFVVAIAATGIFYGLFVGTLKDAAANAPKISVVVAARALPGGTVLKAKDVKLTRYAGSEPMKGAFSTVDAVIGKTVFTPVEESEPVTQARLANNGRLVGQTIAQGMRAICVTVWESGGILSMLRAGHRVDVQAVSGQQGGESRIRTILQDIEVLAVNSQEPVQGRVPTPTVTLLVNPRDADQLALADSAVRIRLLLRNPTDREQSAHPALQVASLFGGSPVQIAPAVRQAAARTVEKPAAAATSQELTLLVKIASATPGALAEMSARFAFPRQPGWMQVSAVDSGVLAEEMLHRLEEQHSLEVYSTTRLTTGNNREVSFQTGSDYQPSAGGAYGLRIQFLPTWNRSGNLRLRVRPEITSPGATAVSICKFESEVELSEGQIFVVTGLGNPADLPSLAERLFAGRVKEPANRELFVVVTPHVVRPVETVARRGSSE